jgi:hypothetical protein
MDMSTALAQSEEVTEPRNPIDGASNFLNGTGKACEKRGAAIKSNSRAMLPPAAVLAMGFALVFVLGAAGGFVRSPGSSPLPILGRCYGADHYLSRHFCDMARVS